MVRDPNPQADCLPTLSLAMPPALPRPFASDAPVPLRSSSITAAGNSRNGSLFNVTHYATKPAGQSDPLREGQIDPLRDNSSNHSTCHGLRKPEFHRAPKAHKRTNVPNYSMQTAAGRPGVHFDSLPIST